jgi:hypothetical protein
MSTPPLLSVLADTTSKLRELDERIHLHSTFRQQRIKYLGWTSNLVQNICLLCLLVYMQCMYRCSYHSAIVITCMSSVTASNYTILSRRGEH